MFLFHRRQLALIFLLLSLGVAIALFFMKRQTTTAISPPPQAPVSRLSALATAPDWRSLEIFQNSISRTEFEQLLTSVFVSGDRWKNFIQIDADAARIQTGNPSSPEFFQLNFAQPGAEKNVSSCWQRAGELPATTPDRPLANLHIAIDPGHIGGDWAKMEERWFAVGTDPPVCEGEMTLAVAKLLKPQLEALGARVSLVRDQLQPVTLVRPDQLRSLALDAANPETSESPRKLAERLFYRTAEIHARAERVNQSIKPDLVLCLHFNAADWGNATQPTLVDSSHLHILVNGSYGDDEIAMEDQRYTLLLRLLQRNYQEEIAIAASVATTFATASGLPPYQYAIDSKNARPISQQPYLWTRNLLANRLYHCPVIFMEPYVMNSRIDYARIQAGDYEGLRDIAGVQRPAIFREYANAVASGLARYYAATRKITGNPVPAEP